MPAPRTFLTASWEHVLLLNYTVPRSLLEPLVPPGTELDVWQGDCIASLVGFQFLGTRVRGIPLPWYGNFEEINLRFYVTRKAANGEVRRGVVFIRELVKRRLVAAVARALYNEPYIVGPTESRLAVGASSSGRIAYTWRFGGQPFTLEGRFNGIPKAVEAGSETEFIIEHYWGYTKQKDGSTNEYRVEHPRWRAWEVESASFSGQADAMYGSPWGEILASPPRSVCLAEGSDVSVSSGERVLSPGS